MIFVKLYAHNYKHASIQFIYKNYYTSKLNLVLRIGRVLQLADGKTDNLGSSCSSPLYATIFLPTMFACWHKSLRVETHN